ncbi:phage holin family protein [Sphingomicrobium flavum]|uniref:phage holin family protein n=1 Tax=Sphingomicrobium flavum TaxID=1229164 RepID=UPI0021AD93AB|nr:phage holin family protein [Sphingomicrobium flavum]
MLDEQADPQNFDPDSGIGDLLGRVVNDGREYAAAELNLAKAKAVSHAGLYRGPLVMLAVAGVFGIAAVVTLFVTVALALATLVGPLAGGLIATAIAAVIAGGLALTAKSKLEKL